MEITLHDQRLILYHLPADALRIPGTDFYLSPHLTLGELCKAAGLKNYDPALPYEWVKAEYLSKGREYPRGVWSYDQHRIFGEYVSVDDLLKMVAAQFNERGAITRQREAAYFAERAARQAAQEETR